MLKSFDDEGNMKNIKITEDGEVVVKISGGNTGEETVGQTEIINEETNPIPVKEINPVTIPNNFKVNNGEDSPVPVKVTNQVTIPNEIKVNNTTDSPLPVSVQGQEVETTLNASVQTVGATATTIAINKKVTQVDIANYSETANITIALGEINAVIGANIATTLKINKQVDNITLTSTEEGTNVQLVVSGVE